MTSAVWRPNRREAYPVLGVERYHSDGVHADVVCDMPGLEFPDLIEAVPLAQIQLQPRSIIRALTADFEDHSALDRCRCAERAEGPLTPTLTPHASLGRRGCGRGSQTTSDQPTLGVIHDRSNSRHLHSRRFTGGT